MKFLSKLLLLCTWYAFCYGQNSVDCDAIIQPHSQQWQTACIDHLSTQEVATIANMLLLSYQIVRASVAMTQARLQIQTELLHIVTLSINDSLEATVQAQSNDLTAIKNAIVTIEKSQDKIKFACNALKNFGPLVINIDPTTIQNFITNLKTVILQWAKTQENTVEELEQLKETSISSTHLFDNFKALFDSIVSSDQIEHSQLLHSTNSLSDMYKKTEDCIADLTVIRQQSLANFNKLLTLYFKYHYQILYDRLQNIDTREFKLIAMPDQNIPSPDLLFAMHC